MAENSVTAAPLRLHALWKPESGLHLWVERPEVNGIVADISGTEVPEEVREIFSVLEGAQHSILSVALLTPTGRKVHRRVPTWVFAPWQAVSVLAQLRPWAAESAISPELRFLLDVFAGMEAFARSGRALVALIWEDGSWWPTWRLAEGLHEIAWRHQVIQRTPPILVANEEATVAEDFINRMFHWVVNELLSDLDEPASQRQNFVRSLLQSESLERPVAGVAAALARWRESADVDEMRLLLVVEEPDDIAPEQLTDTLMWPVRLYFRVGVSAPQYLDPEMCSPAVLATLQPQLQRAQQAFPTFAEAKSANEGLDLLLTATQLVELVSEGVAKLKAAGIDTMMPANWKLEPQRMALMVSLEKLEPTGAAGRRQNTKLGFEQIVDYSWSLAVGDVVLTEAELNELAASTSGLVRLRQHWVYADPERAREAVRFLKERTQAGRELGSGATKLRRFVYPNGETELAPLPVKQEDSGWLAAALGTQRQQKRQPIAVPAGFRGQLRAYQESGLQWLADMSQRGFGVILADDMGLGKTIQILALLQHEVETGQSTQPTLLVAPTGVIRNWVNEARRFTPDLKVGLFHGSHRPRSQDWEQFLAEHHVVITTYGVARREFQLFGEVEWEHVIADEAQAIKNPNSQASRALRSFRSRQNIAMTGTPVENNLGEMRSIMDFCNPGMLGDGSQFRAKFAVAIERDGDMERLEQLRAITAPFILRRMKSDPAIVPDLPQKNEQIEQVALTPEQAVLYERAVMDIEEQASIALGPARARIVLGGITKLKQICNHPAHFLKDGSAMLHRGSHRSGKVARMEQLVEKIVTNGERVLIFTQYVKFGEMIVAHLEQLLDMDISFIHGGLSPRQREQAVADFNQGLSAPVMVLSTMAAGVGINLTAANHVIHMDRWWNPAVENQATDRSYRIGQQKDVHVHKMVSVGTLEERIDELIFEKSELAEAAVAVGETKITEMDIHRLRALWQLDRKRIADYQEDNKGDASVTLISNARHVRGKKLIRGEHNHEH